MPLLFFLLKVGCGLQPSHFCNKFIKEDIAVIVADGYFVFVDVDVVILERGYLLGVDDVRTVYPQEYFRK